MPEPKPQPAAEPTPPKAVVPKKEELVAEHAYPVMPAVNVLNDRGDRRDNYAGEWGALFLSGQNHNTALAVERVGGDVRDKVGTVGMSVINRIADSEGKLQLGQAEIRRDVSDAEARLTRDHATLRVELNETKAQLQRETLVTKHDLTLLATQNAAAISKQLAECCCELRAENAQTRELIRAQETERLRAELIEAQHQLRAYQNPGCAGR